MHKPVYVLNGPNLNCLGFREPEIYGHETLADVEAMTRAAARRVSLEVEFRQSNHEGVLVDWIQEARTAASAIVINPAGYTTNSVAIVDALRMFPGPRIELHLSNIHARDAAHNHSLVSTAVEAQICGLGAYGYEAAVAAAAHLLRRRAASAG